MKLRKYQKEDAAIICSWIKDEKSLYKWSANKIGKFTRIHPSAMRAKPCLQHGFWLVKFWNCQNQ